MKIHNIYMLMTLLPSLAMAQVQSTDLSGDLNVELRKAERQLPSYNSNNAASSATNNTSVIVETRVEELPSTLVEASPLTDSRAERLRKQREAAELNTEMMIVEQLEKDRIEAERRRAQKLFGNKLQEEEAAPVAAPIVQEDENLKQEIQEIRSIIDEQKNRPKIVEEEYEEPAHVESSYAYEPAEMQQDSSFLMGVNLGAGSYPGVKNVEGVYALGFSVGMEFEDGLIVEGNFTNSSYDVDSFSGGGIVPVELTQNSISGILKYRILKTRVAPVVGGIASYTLRDYQERGGFLFPGGRRSASSQALDLGLILGADIKVSPKFSVGLDMKYLFNITNRIDDDSNPFANSPTLQQYGLNNPLGGTPIEELEQLIISVNAALKF